MRPVTSRFLTAVQQSHRLAILVEVVRPSVSGTPPLELVDTLPSVITGGHVTLDASAQIRGRVDLTLVDDGTLGLVPTVPTDLLAPYGNELRVYRGLQYPDGTRELVSLGIFRIEETGVDDSPQGMTISITAQDRAATVMGARFEEPFQVAAGTLVTDAIDDALHEAFVNPVGTLAVSSAVTPLLVVEEGADRWQFCTDLAKSIGMRLYWDGDGEIVLAPDVTGGAPVVQFVEGVGGVLVSAARRWDRTSAFNRVIATGENTGEALPVRGVATDDDALSPTYYDGPFGKTPRFYQSSFLTTTAQATDAAAAILQRELGTTQRVSFGTYVNPALEPGDIAQITRLRAGVDEAHVIDAISIPLTADGVMTGSTKATQTT